MKNRNKKSALLTQGNFTFHFVVTMATGCDVDGVREYYEIIVENNGEKVIKVHVWLHNIFSLPLNFINTDHFLCA